MQAQIQSKIQNEPKIWCCLLSAYLSLPLWANKCLPHVPLYVSSHPLDSIHDAGFPVRILTLHTVPGSFPQASKKCWDNPAPGILLFKSQAHGKHSHFIFPSPFGRGIPELRSWPWKISLEAFWQGPVLAVLLPFLAILETLGRHIPQCKFLIGILHEESTTWTLGGGILSTASWQ